MPSFELTRGAIDAACILSAHVVLALFAHYGLRGLRGGIRWAGFVAGTMAALSLPWLAPVEVPLARFVAALWSFLATLRLADVAWDRYPDPRPAGQFGWFLFTWFIGPDARWPTEDHERAELRRAGARRAVRGVAQLGGACAMFAVSTAWPAIHDGLWTQAAWTLATTLFLMPGVLAVASGLAMLPGVWVDETFDSPALSRSPRDFWSRRWNRLFQSAAQRHIFRPLLRRRGPLVAIVAVFVFSAVLHEYLIIASVGATTGAMSAFFGLHCLGTLADWATRHRPRLPRPLAIAAHTAWFWAGFPLFMVPIFQAMPLHELRLW